MQTQSSPSPWEITYASSYRHCVTARLTMYWCLLCSSCASSRSLVVVRVSLTQRELVTVLLLVSAGHEEHNRTVSMSGNRESVNRVFFLLVGEKALKIETLFWLPEKLRSTWLLSAFISEHSIDASRRGSRYPDSPVVCIHSLNLPEDAECK